MSRAISSTRVPVGGGHRGRLLGISILAVVVAFALLPINAEARSVERKATSQVQKWTSPKAYSSPYAQVDVMRQGRRLAVAPVTGCKVHFFDQSIDVLISTCGKRWRLRASYVSLDGKHKRFKIRYSARG